MHLCHIDNKKEQNGTNEGEKENVPFFQLTFDSTTQLLLFYLFLLAVFFWILDWWFKFNLVFDRVNVDVVATPTKNNESETGWEGLFSNLFQQRKYQNLNNDDVGWRRMRESLFILQSDSASILAGSLREISQSTWQ